MNQRNTYYRFSTPSVAPINYTSAAISCPCPALLFPAHVQRCYIRNKVKDTLIIAPISLMNQTRVSQGDVVQKKENCCTEVHGGGDLDGL